MKNLLARHCARFCVVAIAGLACLSEASAGAVPKLTTITVSLPDPLRQFQGADAAAINNNCLVCHSAGMVLNQPAMNKATWTVEVNKMINAFKAPVQKADVPAIIAYLVKHKGTR